MYYTLDETRTLQLSDREHNYSIIVGISFVCVFIGMIVGGFGLGATS